MPTPASRPAPTAPTSKSGRNLGRGSSAGTLAAKPGSQASTCAAASSTRARQTGARVVSGGDLETGLRAALQSLRVI
jgi:hypothetical protein